MTNKQRMTIKIVLPLLILIGGASILYYFNANKPVAKTRKRPFLGALVQIEPLKKETRQIEIHANGVVHAKERITLTARIAGVAEELNPVFVEGGFFKKGDLLMKIQPTIEANAYYTLLRAPFNGVVQSVDVSEGQYVTPGFKLASLIGSDQAQVHVDLPLSDISRLSKNRTNDNFAFPAKIQLDYGTHLEAWDGTVKRNLMEMTSKGMMAQLMVDVADPFRLNRTTEQDQLPLFIGAFVDVTIPALVFKDVFIIPVASLHEQNTVYLVKDGLLEIRTVSVTYRSKDEVFIAEGLQNGEQLVTSPLKGAAPGLKVRIEGQEPPRRRGGGQFQGEGRAPTVAGEKRGGRQGNARGGDSNFSGKTGTETQAGFVRQAGSDGNLRADGQRNRSDGEGGAENRPEGRRGDGKRQKPVSENQESSQES